MASQQLFDSPAIVDSPVTTPQRSASGPGFIRMIGRMLAWAELAASIRRERRELSRLPAALRHDIGLTDAQICREVSQPWFAIPANRLRR